MGEDDFISSLNTGDILGGICLSFYELLWKKKNDKQEKQAQFRDFYLNVPDTIVYNFSKPQFWYFTSKSKEEIKIKKKKRQNLNSKTILDKFLPAVSKSGIAALYMYTDETPQGRQRVRDGGTPLCIRYMDSEGLKSDLLRLGSISDNGVLQQFVDPKPAVDGTVHNNIIQTYWQPNHVSIERRQNKHSLTDSRLPYQTRAETFDGTFQNSDSYPLMSTIILDEIKGLNNQIAEHLFFVADCIVKRMVLNWKIDSNNRVWFLFCSALSVVERDKETIFRQPADLLSATVGNRKQKDDPTSPQKSHGSEMMKASATAVGIVRHLRRGVGPDASRRSIVKSPREKLLDRVAAVNVMTRRHLENIDSPNAGALMLAHFQKVKANRAVHGAARGDATTAQSTPANAPPMYEQFNDLMWGGRNEALKRILFDTGDFVHAAKRTNSVPPQTTDGALGAQFPLDAAGRTTGGRHSSLR